MGILADYAGSVRFKRLIRGQYKTGYWVIKLIYWWKDYFIDIIKFFFDYAFDHSAQKMTDWVRGSASKIVETTTLQKPSIYYMHSVFFSMQLTEQSPRCTRSYMMWWEDTLVVGHECAHLQVKFSKTNSKANFLFPLLSIEYPHQPCWLCDICVLWAKNNKKCSRNIRVTTESMQTSQWNKGNLLCRVGERLRMYPWLFLFERKSCGAAGSVKNKFWFFRSLSQQACHKTLREGLKCTSYQNNTNLSITGLECIGLSALVCYLAWNNSAVICIYLRWLLRYAPRCPLEMPVREAPRKRPDRTLCFSTTNPPMVDSTYPIRLPAFQFQIFVACTVKNTISI